MSPTKNSGSVIPLRRRQLAKPRSADSLLNVLGAPTEEALYQLHEVVGKFERALPPPNRFRAIIFGSSRVKPGSAEYEETRAFARALSERGLDIVTGGGPGIMEAASKGAMEGRQRNPRVWSWGICIESVYDRFEPPNDFLSRAYRHRNFFTRLHQFARLGASGVFVVMPGGIGTLLEIAMIWQLLQVKHLKGCRLIIADPMWHAIIETFKEHAIARGYMRAEEAEHLTLVSSVKEALPLVIDDFKNFKKKRAAG